MSEQSDRGLLEQAAKVAGMDFKHGYTSDIGYLYFPPKADDSPHAPAGRFWTPLTDDGDALRLAVKLELQILPDVWDVDVAHFSGRACATEKWESHDRYAATRRAIVRAAAELAGAA